MAFAAVAARLAPMLLSRVGIGAAAEGGAAAAEGGGALSRIGSSVTEGRMTNFLQGGGGDSQEQQQQPVAVQGTGSPPRTMT